MKTQVATRPSAVVDRAPARQRLADLNATLAEMGRRSQELATAVTDHDAAKRAEGSALVALQEFVTEELIEAPDAPDKTRRALLAHAVRQARAEIDRTAALADEANALVARQAEANAERDRIIRLTVVEEGRKLAAFYHDHARQAEAAKAAVLSLARWMTYSADEPLVAQNLTEALNAAPATPEGALEFARIKAAIEAYAGVWSALPDMLAADADATVALPEPLHEVAPAKLEQAA